MKTARTLVALAAALLGGIAAAQAETLTIATVNNSDMIIMQKLAPKWEQADRQQAQLGRPGGERAAPARHDRHRHQGRTVRHRHHRRLRDADLGQGRAGSSPLDTLGDDYDYADIFEPVKNGLSVDGKLYAVPFYAESSFTFYRKDLFDAAGLKMPEQPTYDQIAEFAAKLTDKSKEQYGICLRGKPGWGENMAFVGTLVNTFGGSWFDMNWQPQLTSEPWKKAVTFYVDLMNKYGPPGATSNGHNENRALFATGHCAMWIDATSAAGYIYNPKESQVADKTAFTKAPVAVTPNGSGWAWAWALGIPASSQKQDAAKSFLKWATSKDYVKLVGESEGWVAAPPGTRKSTYENADYKKAAPFADTVLQAILTADPSKPTKDPVPYTGVQFVAIPEFQAIGTTVGQAVAAALSGQQTVDQALQGAQDTTLQTMQQAGYIQ